MRELTIEQRLIRMEENIEIIKRKLEELAGKGIILSANEDRKDIMTVKQTAQFLGVDANIIYTKCANGDIPYFKIGKQYRFRKVDILKWLKERKIESDFSVDDFVDRYMQGHPLKS